MGILPFQKVRYSGSHSGCVPTGSKNFPYKPSLTRPLLQRNHDGRDIWMLVFLFLWVWGLSLRSKSQGKLRLKNDLQARAFKHCETLSTQNVGKAIFICGRKGINRECVFRPQSSKNCLASKVWDFQACQEKLIPESGQIVCMLFRALWTHS